MMLMSVVYHNAGHMKRHAGTEHEKNSRCHYVVEISQVSYAFNLYFQFRLNQ